MSFCRFDLVEFLEQLTGVEFSVVFGTEPLDRLWMPSVLALPNNSPAQSMVFLWISMVSDSSAEITWSIVRM